MPTESVSTGENTLVVSFDPTHMLSHQSIPPACQGSMILIHSICLKLLNFPVGLYQVDQKPNTLTTSQPLCQLQHDLTFYRSTLSTLSLLIQKPQVEIVVKHHISPCESANLFTGFMVHSFEIDFFVVELILFLLITTQNPSRSLAINLYDTPTKFFCSFGRLVQFAISISGRCRYKMAFA